MPKDSLKVDVVIMGAGAAGLMCAITAGQRGRSVVVLEHNPTVGKKIRISGGGRCNFTNLHTTPANFLSQNEHFAKSALARYSPFDFSKLIEKHKIPYHEKTLGQLFCDHTAQDVIDMLKKESQEHNVKILTEAKITSVKKDQIFVIVSSKGNFQAESLVIATGGLSIPPLGATSFGYKIAEQFGIKVNPTRPGLVPLTLSKKDLAIFQDLSGVSIDTIVSYQKMSFREATLFTHKGLSGPAILQISSYWEPKNAILINLLPDHDMAEILKQNQSAKTTLKNFLKDYLPNRLTDVLCTHFLENKPLNQYSSAKLKTIGERLNRWEFFPEGTEGYAKAEVTVGGVDTNELSSKTMEAKKVPGLYFIGEVVDVTGHLGGFNFQWAWASGHAAGECV